MKHIQKFEDFVGNTNSTEAPAENATTETPAAETTATEKPASEIQEESVEIQEGNAFTAALMKARNEGLKEFEFNGKVYPVKESNSSSVMGFDEFVAENFALYPGYNNMLGSEVLRNVPITHQVNMAVYGKPNVVDQSAPAEEPAVVVVTKEK